MTPTIRDANELLLNGLVALAQIEHHGIRVNTEYLDQAIADATEKIKKTDQEMKSSEVYDLWRRRFGEKTNLSSNQQAGVIFFDQLGYKSKGQTATGRHKTDKLVIAEVDHPFARQFTQLNDFKREKTRLENLRRETVDGYFHPTFNLHLASTFRSSSGSDKADDRSSSEFNFQNIPNRDDDKAATIRKCFQPRGIKYRIAEVDYAALEFRIAACFWNDPNMIEYASDPSKDVHGDMAKIVYRCTKEEAGDAWKKLRYHAKNGFVFPILYGSYFRQCAKNLWETVEKGGYEVEGMSLRSWLKSKGIKGRGACEPKQDVKSGTFEAHMKEVEQEFLDQFPVFKRRKEEWWTEYQSSGSFTTLTGFPLSGVFSRNFLMNGPIQSIAFHCLLWSLTRLNAWLRKTGLKSRVIGQIHDCILIDVHEDEIQIVLNKCRQIMTVDVRKHWDWITVPLGVEVDVTPRGGTWYDKKPWIEVGGKWTEKG